MAVVSIGGKDGERQNVHIGSPHWPTTLGNMNSFPGHLRPMNAEKLVYRVYLFPSEIKPDLWWTGWWKQMFRKCKPQNSLPGL